MEKMQKFSDEYRVKCPIHNEHKCVVWRDGAPYCGIVGLQLSEQELYRGPERRWFTEEEKAERIHYGPPSSPTVHDKGLSTAIGGDRDYFGRKLPLSTRRQMKRLEKWHIRSRAHSSVDKNLIEAMAELDRLSDKVYIPSSVKERAAVIYRRALNEGLVRGRSIAAIAAASLYAACRNTETPRSLKEIAEASPVDKKYVGQCYRYLVRELEIEMPIADPLKYVSKIAGKTGISDPIQLIASKILQKAKRTPATVAKDPMGLVAAALYIATEKNGEQNDKKVTQKDLAEAAGITEVTLRNRKKGLEKQLALPD